MKIVLLAVMLSIISTASRAEFFCGKEHPGVIIIRMSNLPKKQQATVAEWKQYLKQHDEKILKICKDKGHTVIVSENVLKMKAAIIFDHLKKT